VARTIIFEQQAKPCLDLVAAVVEVDSVEAGVPAAAGVAEAEVEAVVDEVGVEVIATAAVPVDEEEEVVVEGITQNL